MITIAAKKNYSLIGRILYKTRPEIASQLEYYIQPGTETDLKRIFYFYSRFDGFDLPGYNEVNKRRLFTAAMLKLYHPNYLKSGIINVKYGFAKNIACCFGCKTASVSINIKEVVIMYRAYTEFEEKVNEILENFKTTN